MIDFEVTSDNGDEFTVTADSRDVLQWEASDKSNAFSNLAENARMTDFYALAYFAAKRSGHFDGTQKAFQTSCTVIPVQADEPDPTQ